MPDNVDPAPDSEPPPAPKAEAKPKTPRKPREVKDKAPSRFVNQRVIAAELGVEPKTVRRWVDRAEWPLPAMIQGTLLFWKRADYEHWIRTRCWPRGMEFRVKR